MEWCHFDGNESDSQTLGFTALMRAALWDHADCLRLLINAGADKDSKDYVRVGLCVAFTPHFACVPCSFCLHVDASLISYLFRCLNFGIPMICCLICIRFANNTCLCCVHWRWRRVSWFESMSQHGRTALIFAADFGHTVCAQLLLNAGADAKAKSRVCTVGCSFSLCITMPSSSSP